MNIRTLLVIVSLVLSVTLGLTLSRNNQSGEQHAAKDGLVIGLSMDTLKEARWQRDRDVFKARAEALGAKVLVQSANSDDTRQMQDVNGLIANGVDVLVIVPHNGAAMAQAVRAAHAAGIPVVAYDRLITDCDLDLYISFDNVNVGRQQARYLVEHIPLPARIVRLYGAPTDNNAYLFKQGQDEVLAPYIERGDIVVIHEDFTDDWSPANAKKIMNAAITAQGTDFSAVLASNDGTAGGAIQALKENALAGKVLVTGQDADLVACQRIVNGTQTMSIYKPLKNLATRAADLAVDLAGRRPVIAAGSVGNGFKDVPSVLLEVVAIDKDNLMDTVVADAFHTEAEIWTQD